MDQNWLRYCRHASRYLSTGGYCILYVLRELRCCSNNRSRFSFNVMSSIYAYLALSLSDPRFCANLVCRDAVN
jgi:hypothetical protein